MALIYKKAYKVQKAQLGISQMMLQAGGLNIPGFDMNLQNFNTGTTGGQQNIAALNAEEVGRAKADMSGIGTTRSVSELQPVRPTSTKGPSADQLVKSSQAKLDGSKLVKQAADKGGGLSGAMPGIGMAASAASGIVAGFGDDGDDNYTGGEQAADIGASALKYGAMGAQFGPWGAAAGAVVGTVMGVVGVNKRNKGIHQNAWKKAEKEEKDAAESRKTSIANRTANVSAAADAMYGSRIGGNNTGGYGTAVVRKGGKFIFKETSNFAEKLDKNKRIGEVIFKRGGKLSKLKKGGKVKPTENIIPNGVLHEEKNSLGDNGMPVVKCTKESCTKHYEIEKDEMILTLSTTKKVEELAYGGRLDELGEFVKKQILDNTHSYTKKFKFLNEDETIYIKGRR